MKSLGAQLWTIEQRPEFNTKLGDGFGWNRLVIANTDEERHCAEWLDLMLQEVLPGRLHIVRDARRRHEVTKPPFGGKVFVYFVDGAKIAEVPVELCVIASRTLCDSRHHDIAAVARVS